MNFISILYNKLHLLKISSPLIGKKKIHTSSVTIPASEARNFNIDVWALHFKKALEKMAETKFTNSKAQLILDQRFWKFIRIEIPADIQDSAMEQFLKEELQGKVADFQVNSLYKFYLAEHKGKRVANIFILPRAVLTDIETLLSFYDIDIDTIYPEAVLIFRIFEHTLNKKKEETALFMEYGNELSTGLLFDSAGLYKEEPIVIESDSIRKSLKEFKLEETSTIARLILGGEMSTGIRQDNFTKDTGLWTNPLEKVLDHSSYRQFAQKHGLVPKLLEFHRELSLLKAIEDKTAAEISIPVKGRKDVRALNNLSFRRPAPRSASRLLRNAVFILVSFTATFLLLNLALRNIGAIRLPSFRTATPTPVPTRRPTAVPTVAVDRADVTIDIQNGVGTPGLANSFKTELTDLGYAVGTVGNAENYDYENTVIIAPDRATFNLLREDLGDWGVSSPVYENTNASRVTIIIGADLDLP